MSLFASAFDTGLPAGSSSKPYDTPASTKAAKRKRPSTGSKDDQLRTTHMNLEKLMSKVEKQGALPAEGREAMGQKSKPKKARVVKEPEVVYTKKGGKFSKPGNDQGWGGERKPRDLDDPKALRASLGAGVGRERGPREIKGKGPAKRDDQRPAKQHKPDTPKGKQDGDRFSKPAARSGESPARPATAGPAAGNSRPAPAELPLPHSIPASELSKPEGDEQLTDLQKGMRAKLEGARFRCVTGCI
jgi:hypothetical protein